MNKAMFQWMKYRGTKTWSLKKLCASVPLCSFNIITILAALSFVSCEEAYDDFPRMEVRFTCSLQQSPYSFITTPGQFLTVTKKGAAYVVDYPGQPSYTDGKQGVFLGFGGLILGQPTITMDVSSPYAAYDRACPVEAEDLVISRLNINTNHEGKCPKCGTVYDLDTGFPKQGEGKKRLKTYKVYAIKTNTGTNLTVRN